LTTRVIFHGDSQHPFELVIYESDASTDPLTIPLTPQQVINLIAEMSDRYASWAQAQSVTEYKSPPPA
jgi:hypothetical protein